MDPFGLQQIAAAPAAAEAAEVTFAVMLPRLAAAVALAFALASRPWRLLMGQPLPKTEMIHAQVLLCAAASVITVVIGDSVAKAFGLVGLGSFVRFRSGLKDPRDAAILFLLIGLGMALGHGNYELAAVAAASVGAVLLGMDAFARPKPQLQRVKLAAQVDDLEAADLRLREAFGKRNVIVRSTAMDVENRRIELEVEESVPGSMVNALKDPGAPQLRALRWATISQGSSKEDGV